MNKLQCCNLYLFYHILPFSSRDDLSGFDGFIMKQETPHSFKFSKFFLFKFFSDVNIRMTQSMKRPVGVTIIAILAIVGGIVLIFGGLSSLISGAFFAVMPIEVVMTQQQQYSRKYKMQQNYML
jgi:hypothetical protein